MWKKCFIHGNKLGKMYSQILFSVCLMVVSYLGIPNGI